MIRCCLLLVFIATSGADAFDGALLVANTAGARYINYSSKASFNVWEHSAGVNGVDYHYERKEIYFILKSTNKEDYNIVRVTVPDKLDSSIEGNTSSDNLEHFPDTCSRDKTCKLSKSRFLHLQQVLKPESCYAASNLVVDWIHNTLYWSCDRLNSDEPGMSRTASIGMASTNGTTINSITMLNNTQVSSFAVDPFEKKLYWIEYQKVPKSYLMKSSGLHGEDIQMIHQFDNNTIKYPLTFGFDVHKKIAYVIGKQKIRGDYHVLFRKDFYTDNIATLRSCNRSFGVIKPEIFKSTMYFISNTSALDNTCFHENNSKEHVKTLLVKENVIYWRMYHPDMQPSAKNYFCSVQNCSHYCNYTPTHDVHCWCPGNMTLLADSRTCSGKGDTCCDNGLYLLTTQQLSNNQTAPTEQSHDEVKQDHGKTSNEAEADIEKNGLVKELPDKTEDHTTLVSLHQTTETTQPLLKTQTAPTEQSHDEVKQDTGKTSNEAKAKSKEMLSVDPQSTKPPAVSDIENNGIVKEFKDKTDDHTTLVNLHQNTGIYSPNETQKHDVVSQSPILKVTTTAELFNNETATSEAKSTDVASTGTMLIVYSVIASMFFSLFILMVVIKRRAKKGNYRPASPEERIDIMM